MILAAQHAEQALELRLQGLTFREIGARLELSKTAAHQLVTDALAAAVERGIDAADTLRQLEAERLDRYLRTLDPKIELGDLGALAEARKIGERRARLLGLDRPALVDLQILDSEKLASLTTEQLARLAAGENPREVLGSPPRG